MGGPIIDGDDVDEVVEMVLVVGPAIELKKRGILLGWTAGLRDQRTKFMVGAPGGELNPT